MRISSARVKTIITTSTKKKSKKWTSSNASKNVKNSSTCEDWQALSLVLFMNIASATSVLSLCECVCVCVRVFVMCLTATSSTSGGFQFEGCVAELLQTITTILLDRNGVVCSFALCCKMFREVMKKVFMDNITAFLEGRNKELADIAEKVLRAMRMEVEESL